MASRRLDELAAELVVEIARNLWLGDMSQLAQANRRLHQIIDPFLYLTDAQPYNQYALFWAARHNLPTVAERALRAGTPAVSPYREPCRLRPFSRALLTEEELKAVTSPDHLPSAWTPLDIAAGEGHVEVVALLLRQPMEDVKVTMAIKEAASCGQVKTMEMILQHAKHTCGRVAEVVEAAFCAAADAGQRAVLERLLETKGGPLAVDKSAQYYITSMMKAAGTGHDEVWDLLSSVQLLAEIDANPATQHEQLSYFLDMNCAGKGSRGILELVGRFISLGLDLTSETMFSSLLYSVCRRDNAPLLEMLLSYSANEQQDRETLFRRCEKLQTSKMLLARGIPQSLCREVFQSAVSEIRIDKAWLIFSTMYSDIERMSDDAGDLLHVACHQVSLKVVQLLLSVGTSRERRDKAEWQRNYCRPLQALMNDGREEERLEIAALLLEAGADPNKRGDLGDSPLSYACRYGLPKVAQLLLEHGADPHYWANCGTSILHTACAECPDVGLIQALLKRGADPTARTVGGATPLHQLCLGKSQWARTSPSVRYQIAKLLIAHGADASAENATGATPLHHASIRIATDPEDAKVILALLEHGADIEKRTKHGFGPPLFLACSNLNPYVVSLLLAQGAHLSAHTLSGLNGEYYELTSEGFADGYLHETIKLLLNHAADKGTVRQALLLPLGRQSRTFDSLRLLLMRGGTPDKDTRIFLRKNTNRLRTEALAKALGMVSVEPYGNLIFDPETSVALSWPDEKRRIAHWMEDEDEDVMHY